MYQPRQIKKLPVLQIGNIDWKRYLIRYDNEAPAGALLEAAERVSGPWEEPKKPRPLQNAGFLIVHAGSDMDFVLFGYWVNGNELMLNVYKAPPGRSGELARADLNESSVACVWDLVVISYERDAWVQHILLPPAPDREAWLLDQIECVK